MNKTANYLLEVLGNQLSKKLVYKYTMTDLIRSSGVKRGTIYYHFDDLNDVFDSYIETLLAKRLVMESMDEQVYELVDFISTEKILCLNLYHLMKTKIRRTYFLNLLKKSFQQFELCNEEQGSYLVGGFLFILMDWLDDGLKEPKEVILVKLFNYIELVRVVGLA